MRRCALIAGLYVAFPLLAFAQHDHMQMGGNTAAAPGPSKAAPASAGKQTTCPVTGEPIKEDVSVVSDGQKVYFCCPACISKFQKSPATYLPPLYKQLYPQQVQVKCPVMGGPIDPKVTAEYKGQQVHFCCSGCDKKFINDPAKYEEKLKDSFTQQVHCPVTGNPIDPAQKLEEKGRTIYFDSKESLAKYKSDPAKYAAAANPAGVLAAGPTAKDDIVVSPVNGSVSKRGSTQSLVYEGRTYFFAKAADAQTFKTNPEKYLKQLDALLKDSSKPASDSGASHSHGSMHCPPPSSSTSSRKNCLPAWT